MVGLRAELLDDRLNGWLDLVDGWLAGCRAGWFDILIDDWLDGWMNC